MGSPGSSRGHASQSSERKALKSSPGWGQSCPGSSEFHFAAPVELMNLLLWNPRGAGPRWGWRSFTVPQNLGKPHKEHKLSLKEFCLEVWGVKVPTWDRESWGQPQVLGGMEQLFCGGTGQISHLGAEGASRQRFLTQHGCEHRDVMERWGLGRKEKKEVAFGMCGATQRGAARSLCPGDEGEGGSDSGLVYKLLQKPG